MSRPREREGGRVARIAVKKAFGLHRGYPRRGSKMLNFLIAAARPSLPSARAAPSPSPDPAVGRHDRPTRTTPRRSGERLTRKQATSQPLTETETTPHLDERRGLVCARGRALARDAPRLVRRHGRVDPDARARARLEIFDDLAWSRSRSGRGGARAAPRRRARARRAQAAAATGGRWWDPGGAVVAKRAGTAGGRSDDVGGRGDAGRERTREERWRRSSGGERRGVGATPCRRRVAGHSKGGSDS